MAALSDDPRSANALGMRGSPTWVLNEGRKLLTEPNILLTQFFPPQVIMHAWFFTESRSISAIFP
jgi:hypothetical protein